MVTLRSKIILLLTLLVLTVSSTALAAVAESDFSYRGVRLGDTYERMVAAVGEPLYDRERRVQGVALKQYVYKDDFEISIAVKTGRVVDITSSNKKYELRPGIRYGATYHKLVQTYGRAERQFLDAKTCIVYDNPAERHQHLLLALETEQKYLLAMRITALPLTDEEADAMAAEDDSILASELNGILLGGDHIDTSALPPAVPVRLGGLG